MVAHLNVSFGAVYGISLVGMVGFPTLTSRADFWEDWLPNKIGGSRGFNLFMFAGMIWTIWRMRNKMAIEKKFSNKPTDV